MDQNGSDRLRTASLLLAASGLIAGLAFYCADKLAFIAMPFAAA